MRSILAAGAQRTDGTASARAGRAVRLFLARLNLRRAARRASVRPPNDSRKTAGRWDRQNVEKA